ncbi:Amino-acid carrier protein AlsT [Salinivirga cyanobacteriivorans]|uniref:Amino-acid carrier protein AlsT n=1 Tax=Salinivirga cyanobacteriivorans TaxID=1307839 RepID=A0A0S2I571_9BACT|nr:sodium:alanine symporter family protein [Salinivirga cyanobacteriivorans]ALO17488.1 Amino-acid carrier protein AlsT [Salinivirga cyanobacteriivorans]
MQQINDFLLTLHSYLGGHPWFVFLLLGTGLFFTLYLRFPQIRYFKHAIRVVKGKYAKEDDEGDTSHFQALATALSGTVGTGNIAGVALAIHLGGPAALFWMLVTAFFGMTLKFVEITLSHKYRDFTSDGTVSGGPMYYMRKRLNMKWLAAFFAIATVLSSFGSGSLPQINSISNSVFATFGVDHVITGIIMALLLGFVIIGGIRRIARVTEKLVPGMALIYIIGAFAVIAYNYNNIGPAFAAIFTDVINGTSAVGGFIGASFAFAFNNGVNRGLFSNEAGQGSAAIAHASARTKEPVSEGLVGLLGPFIDTIIICTITGLVLLSSGVWSKKVQNEFQETDIVVLDRQYDPSSEADHQEMKNYLMEKGDAGMFTGTLNVVDGEIENKNTLLHARSVAEDVKVYKNANPYTGKIKVDAGMLDTQSGEIVLKGKSLIHSAPLTAEAFTKSYFGDYGQYIISIGLILFAFSTAISWSYYGDRSIIYLFGSKYVIWYRLAYVVAFFFASFTDTSIIWSLSYLTVVFMAIPNLFGILMLRKEARSTIKKYWFDFKKEFPNEKSPE